MYDRTLPPNPDHGFGVMLQSRVQLWVDASYTEFSSSQEEADRQTSGCHIEDKRQVQLGQQPAISLRFTCPASLGESAYTEFLILTVYRVGDRSPAVYEVGLRLKGTKVVLREKKVFDMIAGGFRFTQ